MRIILDLQACQTRDDDRECGQYSLSLAVALARRSGEHEIIIALNARLPERIESVRTAFDGLLPPERVVVFTLPAPATGSEEASAWRSRAAELVRLSFLDGLRPDIVHVSSASLGLADDAVACFDVSPWRFGSSATLFDVDLPADGASADETGRDRRLARREELERVDLLLTTSDDTRARAIIALGLSEGQVVAIPPGVDDETWDVAALRALEAFEELHRRRRHGEAGAPLPGLSRPRLAFVSPLPPERSGIADYSAELLPELARHYEVDVVLNQVRVEDPWVVANTTQRSVAWFDEHASEYDRVVYHFGNSGYHEHMFELLTEHPGVVVLHDFFLSGAVDHCEHTVGPSDAFRRALYSSHGYAAVIDEARSGRLEAAWKYPCNKDVLDRADGLIVHSRHAMHLADDWYGAGYAQDWELIPLLRTPPDGESRRAARRRLGLTDDDFLVCSFGMLGPTKLNDRLLDAWFESPLAADGQCLLVFVGESNAGDYCESLARTIHAGRGTGRVEITGFAPRALYKDYLAAADVAVQLRTLSRGETSAAVLDCLAHGLPTIVNAHGWAAELPDETVVKLPDAFCQAELVEALARVRADDAAREELSRIANDHLRGVHAPRRAADLYRDAIERFAADGPGARRRRLIDSLKAIDAPLASGRGDLIEVARSISANRPPRPPRKMLVDVTAIAREDLKTGIERTSRALVKALLERPPEGYRVEPVYDAGGYYAYARCFAMELFGAEAPPLGDAPVETAAGDVFLGLNLSLAWIPANHDAFVDMRNRGVALYFMVYDLLPVLRPDVFPDGQSPVFERWLRCVTRLADGLVCGSRAVADELIAWLADVPPRRDSPFAIGYFHQGADLAASVPSRGKPPDAASVLRDVRARPTFLMVGTVEPRKGHAQVLSACERLWAAGSEVGLIIVGKEGWDLPRLTRRLRTHPERGKRLRWLEGVSDEMLMEFYASAVALVAASEGEGFGLPLVEAAQHGLPIIARDLPVFREVAGEHAFYFDGAEPDDLAAAITTWLALRERGSAPSSEGLRWLTWAESAAQLLDVIQNDGWYAGWSGSATVGPEGTPTPV
jgi:Glycosyltransferase